MMAKKKEIVKASNKIASKKNYPKGMTIRYDEAQEKEILLMMEKMGENAMSKAFLKAPSMLAMQHKKVNELLVLIEQQQEKINQMQSILDNFNIFNSKLKAFVEAKK